MKKQWSRRLIAVGLVVFALGNITAKPLKDDIIYRDKKGIWYKVRKGDTLGKISVKFWAPMNELSQLNNIFDGKLIPGQYVFVPLSKEQRPYYKKYPFISKKAFEDRVYKEGGKYDFIWPTYGFVTYYLEWRGNSMHYGVDIAAGRGTYIRAAQDGIVVYSKFTNQGYGNLVILKHKDGYTTRYGHCSKLLVEEGEHVKQGQIIALVGSTGMSTGPHLHFEIRYFDMPLQPVHFLPVIAKFYKYKLPYLHAYRNLIDAQNSKLRTKR